MRWMTAFVFVLLSVSSGSAQTTGGIFGGYSHTTTRFEDVRTSTGDSLNGWMAGVDIPILKKVGTIGRVDGTYGDAFHQGPIFGQLGNEIRPSLYIATVGPRVSLASASGLSVFADGLIGVAHGTARRAVGVDVLTAVTDTKVISGAGGGVDVPLGRAMALQFDLQYRRTNLFDQTLNLVQVGTAIVVRPTRH